MRNKKAIFVALVLLIFAAVTAAVGIGEVTKQVGDAAARFGAGGDGPHFVQMKKFLVPVIRRDEVASHINLYIELEVGGAQDKELIKKTKVRLRSAFLQDLSSAALWPDANGEMRLPLSSVKKRLLAISEQVLGPGVVRDVLIKSMIERKL